MTGADLPLELLGQPRRPSSTITPAHRVRAVSEAIKQAKVVKSAKRSEKILTDAEKKLARREKTAQKKLATLSAEGAEDLAREEAEREAAVRRNILDAQQSFMRSGRSWLEYVDDSTRENLLRLIELRHKGLATAADFTQAVMAAQQSVRGPSVTPADYWRRSHPSDGAPLRGGW